jgi:membrane fusion protein (multidrug efflux system)
MDNNKTNDEAIDSVPLLSRKRVMVPAFIALFVLTVSALYWYLNFAGTVSTDDAYIDGNRVTISSKYLGRITQLTVDEGSVVKKGDVLVRLDISDLSAQQRQARASLEYATQSAGLANINLEKAQEDLARAQTQYNNQIIAKEQFDHTTKAFEAAKAQSAIASAQVETARAQLGVVDTQLGNMVITAPMDGVVSKRWALAGDVVQMAQPILSIYDIDHLWVTANLEETNFSKLKLGQAVHIFVDSYGGKKFDGKIIQLGANTAGQFSLIPPNNASGNFTKITQRIPVKISIAYEGPKNKAEPELVPGMSVEVKLKVK